MLQYRRALASDMLGGAQTISVVEEEPLPHQDAFPVEEASEPDDELQAALAAARDRGRRLPKLHQILGGAWAVYRFLVTPDGALDGRTGLDALKRGQDEEVIAAAEGVARGDFR
jgi:hypothetical protein